MLADKTITFHLRNNDPTEEVPQGQLFFYALNGALRIKDSSQNAYSVGRGFKSVAITITQDDIDNKRIILNEAPLIPEIVTITPVGGIPQVNGLDYAVGLNVINWNGMGLDGFLEINDVLIVQY